MVKGWKAEETHEAKSVRAAQAGQAALNIAGIFGESGGSLCAQLRFNLGPTQPRLNLGELYLGSAFQLWSNLDGLNLGSSSAQPFNFGTIWAQPFNFGQSGLNLGST